jgi:hypothetical protein
MIKTKRIGWVGHAACIQEMRNANQILVGKPDGKKQLRRPKHRWTDITMDFRETFFGSFDWIHTTQYRDQWQALVNTIMNLRVP